MPSLSVRRLDDEVYARLRLRAAQRGTSMEEEARRILTQAVSAPERMGALFLATFGGEGGVDLEAEPRVPHEPPGTWLAAKRASCRLMEVELVEAPKARIFIVFRGRSVSRFCISPLRTRPEINQAPDRAPGVPLSNRFQTISKPLTRNSFSENSTSKFDVVPTRSGVSVSNSTVSVSVFPSRLQVPPFVLTKAPDFAS